MTTCLITGGAGFCMSHVVSYLLEKTDWQITAWDSLTYAAEGGYRIKKFENNPRFQFRKIDISGIAINWLEDQFNYIVHGAAETHVDWSIKKPSGFIQSNIFGTFQMLEFARKQKDLKKFIAFGTDEIFGSAGTNRSFTEWSGYNSGNPYAATKAAAEELCLAWANTYGLPITISHSCNIFGENQHSEKLIPKIVRQLLKGEQIIVHTDREGNSGSRQYVYAGDVAKAVHLLLERGERRGKYNIIGKEVDNDAMVDIIGNILGIAVCMKKEYPEQVRPGWDFSYRLEGFNLQGLGWEPSKNFLEHLRRTVEHERARLSVPVS